MAAGVKNMIKINKIFSNAKCFSNCSSRFVHENTLSAQRNCCVTSEYDVVIDSMQLFSFDCKTVINCLYNFYLVAAWAQKGKICTCLFSGNTKWLLSENHTCISVFTVCRLYLFVDFEKTHILQT